MKLNPVLFCGLFLMLSCNMKELSEKSVRISADLVEVFDHKDITTTIGWGTDEEDNRMKITFFNYDTEGTSHEELETLASKVRDRILQQNPNEKELNNIEVRFTNEGDDSEMNEYVTFTYKNE